MQAPVDYPRLNEVAVTDAWPPAPGVGAVYATLRPDPWGDFLDAAYRAGAVLLEVGEGNRILRVFKLNPELN